MVKFRYRPPYRPNGQATYRERNRTGVYLIQEHEIRPPFKTASKIVYIGYSVNDLYRTMYRHFEEWNHTGQEVVTYFDHLKNPKLKYTVRIVHATPKKAAALEKALIKRYKPRDNARKYEAEPLTPYEQDTKYDYLILPTNEELPF